MLDYDDNEQLPEFDESEYVPLFKGRGTVTTNHNEDQEKN